MVSRTMTPSFLRPRSLFVVGGFLNKLCASEEFCLAPKNIIFISCMNYATCMLAHLF